MIVISKNKRKQRPGGSFLACIKGRYEHQMIFLSAQRMINSCNMYT